MSLFPMLTDYPSAHLASSTMLLVNSESTASLVQVNARPSQIRIEGCHCRGNARGMKAEVFLIHDAVWANNEAHYPA